MLQIQLTAKALPLLRVRLLRSLTTAAFIFELLKTEQTPDSIVKAMTDKYDVDEATARADVNELLNLLKSKNIIEE